MRMIIATTGVVFYLHDNVRSVFFLMVFSPLFLFIKPQSKLNSIFNKSQNIENEGEVFRKKHFGTVFFPEIVNRNISFLFQMTFI